MASAGIRERLSAPIVCLALFLEGMSSSSINVQAAAIQGYFDLSRLELQLVASAFLVSYAGFLPLSGRLVDTRDQRTVFIAGLTVFALGSIICAAALSGWFITAGRATQGVGAALSAPAALALITRGSPPGPARNRAIGWYSAMGALGFSAGLVVPAAVVTWAGWRASFTVFVPIIVLIVVVVLRWVPPAPAGGGELDVVGAILFTVGLSSLIVLIGGVFSASPGRILMQAVISVVLISYALFRRRRPELVLLPRSTVTSPAVLTACVSLAGVFAAIVASMFALALNLQLDRGLSALWVGMALLPQSLTNGVLSGVGARLVGRFGPVRVLSLGVTSVLSGLVYLAGPALDVSYVLGVLPATVAIGAGVALCYPACSIMAIASRPERERGSTAALLTMSQNIGGAIGLAVISGASLIPVAGRVDGSGAMVASVALLIGFSTIAVLRGAALRSSPPATTASDDRRSTDDILDRPSHKLGSQERGT